METISSEKKGKKSAKSNPRLGHLEESIQRHLQHVARLELVLRLIDNEALAPEDAEDLKDLIEDYLERNQDDFDEFADPEEMYEDLNLDELDEIKQMAHEVAHSAPTVVEKVIEKVEAAESKKEGGDAGGGGGGGGIQTRTRPPPPPRARRRRRNRRKRRRRRSRRRCSAGIRSSPRRWGYPPRDPNRRAAAARAAR